MVEQIAGFICKELLKDPARKIGPNEPLLSSGLIDSFGLVDLALFVEEAFEVRIEDTELTSSTFDTVAELARLISQKLPGSTS